VFQFACGGLAAEGIEISQPRAAFGRETLGVTIHTDSAELLKDGRTYDCVFTSHVLEHLPSPAIALDFFPKVLRPGGHLIIEVPNCGGRNAREKGVAWGPFSGPLHPLSYTSEFFRGSLAKLATKIHFFDSPFQPEGALRDWRDAPSPRAPDGDNLVVLAQF